MRRLTEHPILTIGESETFTIFYDGKPIEARQGETVAAALLAAGVRVFRHTAKKHAPRGVFCGIGQCTDCVMVVNGQPNTRTCVTRVEEGMVIETQNKVQESDGI